MIYDVKHNQSTNFSTYSPTYLSSFFPLTLSATLLTSLPVAFFITRSTPNRFGSQELALHSSMFNFFSFCFHLNEFLGERYDLTRVAANVKWNPLGLQFTVYSRVELIRHNPPKPEMDTSVVFRCFWTFCQFVLFVSVM